MAGSTLSTKPRLLRHDQPIVRAAAVTAATDILYAGGNSFVPANAPGTVLYLNPDDFDVYERTPRARLRMAVWTGAVNPAVDVYASMYAVASVAGSGTTHAVTLGAEVTDARTPTVSLAAASTAYEFHSDFVLPPLGWYATLLHFSAAMAANSHIDGSGDLTVYNP